MSGNLRPKWLPSYLVERSREEAVPHVAGVARAAGTTRVRILPCTNHGARAIGLAGHPSGGVVGEGDALVPGRLVVATAPYVWRHRVDHVPHNFEGFVLRVHNDAPYIYQIIMIYVKLPKEGANK